VIHWPKARRHPYTTAGIARVGCVRCGAPASVQWRICADDNHYRPLCLDCDIALNSLVLMWMGHPRAATLLKRYVERMIP